MSFELRMSDFDAEQIAYDMGLDGKSEEVKNIIASINWANMKEIARVCVQDKIQQHIQSGLKKGASRPIGRTVVPTVKSDVDGRPLEQWQPYEFKGVSGGRVAIFRNGVTHYVRMQDIKFR